MPGNRDATQRGSSRRGHSSDLLIFCVAVTVAAAVVAGFAWSRPTRIPSALSYRQTGQLSYAAPTSANSLYGTAGLSTGQPIYTKIVKAVHVSYGYRFSSSARSQLTGTEQLIATISNRQGITRAVPIQPPTRFDGSQFSATGTLELASLEAVAKTFVQAAGPSASSDFPVTISPHVELRGRLGPEPLEASFDSPTSFELTATTLVPVSSAGTAGTSGASSQQFRSTTTASVQLPAGQTNTLLWLPVHDVRLGSLVLLVVAAAALVLLVRPLLQDATSDDERVRVATRYGSSLVQVHALPNVHAVELSSFTGLSQVARMLECPILHLQDDLDDTYAVVDNGTLYRYQSPSQHNGNQNGHAPAHASFAPFVSGV